MVTKQLHPVLRWTLLLSVVGALMLGAAFGSMHAQQNLLTNGGFEQGWYDVSGTQQCPNGWKMHWTEGEVAGDANNLTARPESRVLPKTQVPPDEHSLYFWDGDYTVKIFWARSPIHVAMSQDVSGLEVGREYRFLVPAYVDTFIWDSGKQPPNDPYAAQVRLGAGPAGANWRDESAINFSNWANPDNTSPYYLARTTFQYTFVATQPDMRVLVEFKSKWGLDNNGIFMDALRLEPLEMAQTPTSTPLPPPATPTPGPSPTPLPTSTPRPDGSIVHVVESGDTLSGIAFEYDVSIDELRELNPGTIGSDNLIRPGQEIIISVPSESPTPTPLPQPPTATPEGEEEPLPSPTAESEEASVCVLAFHDRNGDTVRDPDSEELLPNVELSLASASGVVAEYTSDGVNEPHCFTGLAPGSYRVSQNPPPGYEPSGPSEQAVAVAQGTSLDVHLGSIRSSTEESSEDTDQASSDTPSSEEGETGATEGDPVGDLLRTVARVAGILVLILAGAIAVLFFLTRRRR